MAISKSVAAEPPKLKGPKRTLEAAPNRTSQQHQAWWRRRVGLLSFFSIPIVLLLLVGGSAYLMYQEIHREVPERIPLGKLAEFQRKKATLANARKLREQGRYVESIAVYDRYLRRYPYSTAAKQGRGAALAQAEASTRKASRQRGATVTPGKAEREKSSVRQRLRRIFRHRS